MLIRFTVLLVISVLLAAEPANGASSEKENEQTIVGTKEWVGIVGLAISVIGVIVALTRYITQIQLQAKLTVKEGELKALHDKHVDLENKYKERLEEIANIKVSGTAALLKKMAVEAELETVTNSLEAAASSILVPEPSPHPNHFVFLCAFGPAAATLRK